jgi:hypothetical protein
MKKAIESLLAITGFAFAGRPTAQVTVHEKIADILAHQVGSVSGQHLASLGAFDGAALDA